MQQDPGLQALPAPLAAAIDAVLAQPQLRIQRVEALGQVAWVKQAEQLSLRWRLQKGDSQAALDRDRQGLQDLAALGLPVAPILATGPRYFVTPDVGVPLSTLLRDPGGRAARAPAFAAAGRALAQFHRAGVAHGRPSLRDICWDGAAARFIDFERYRPGQAGPRSQALDVVILLHSVLAISRAPVPELALVFDAWRSDAPAAVLARLRRMVGQLGWLGGVARLLLRLKPKSRELGAVPMLLDWLRGQLA